MAGKRKVEVFSVGYPACQDTIDLVNSIACPSCEVTVLKMNDDAVATPNPLASILYLRWLSTVI
jgi:hypothetical protein